ncbi:hypothetical protein NL676_038052 [Syzygium grande]|nr:hypothetical protein NL676_038052 [Syzygium grande]
MTAMVVLSTEAKSAAAVDRGGIANWVNVLDLSVAFMILIGLGFRAVLALFALWQQMGDVKDTEYAILIIHTCRHSGEGLYSTMTVDDQRNRRPRRTLRETQFPEFGDEQDSGSTHFNGTAQLAICGGYTSEEEPVEWEWELRVCLSHPQRKKSSCGLSHGSSRLLREISDRQERSAMQVGLAKR